MIFARRLESIFLQTGDIDILDEAIHLVRITISQEPIDDPTLPTYSYTLAHMLVIRIGAQRPPSQQDIDEAMRLFLKCVYATNTYDLVSRIAAARDLGRPEFISSGKMDWNELARATEVAVRLLPKASSRALKRDD